MNTIRRNIPGVVYHLIWRFVDRRWFFGSDAEREVYLGLLGRGLAESDWRCFAFALMSNHIHMALLAGTAPLASWSRRVNAPFAAWMNARHERLGPVFAHCAKDYAIPPAGEASLLAYIHNNPVRAGVASTARESMWTSHRAYLGLVTAPPWLHVQDALARTGMTAIGFAEWVDRAPGESGVVTVNRAAAAAHRRGALHVATPSINGIPLVGRTFAHVRIDPRRIVALAVDLSGVGALVVCSRRRTIDALVVRRAVVHAGRAFGLSDSDIADALGLSQQGISKMGARALSHAERMLAVRICERAQLEISGESRDRPLHFV